nr:NADP-dependent decarboxylating phosphogluconate dehydrogenase [Angustibacter aerolatus]
MTEQAQQEQPVHEGGGTADIGVVGLAVMGANLARNLAHHGHEVALFNRTQARTDRLVEEHGHEGRFVPSSDLAGFAASLSRPRKVIVMVKAGEATDLTLEAVAEHLDEGDVLVDGGNAHYLDTQRRERSYKRKGVHFVGAGISGGEEGALNGPSIMPGGSAEAYAVLGPLLEDISAKVEGEPCCTHIGPDGAGHFVKMVHNGIEYADMQAHRRGLRPAAHGRAAGRPHRRGLPRLERGRPRLVPHRDHRPGAAAGRRRHRAAAGRRDRRRRRAEGHRPLDRAGSPSSLGVPVNAIAEAVFARSTSGHTTVREAARGVLRGPGGGQVDDVDRLVDDVRQALWASKVVAYAQGLDHIRAASDANGWGVDVAEVARIWRGGCIIRARLLERIRRAWAEHGPATLLAVPDVADDLARAQDGWRRTVATAVGTGVPVPAFAASLAYYDTVRRDRLPAALVQGLRDFFGAHTYERTDRPGSFHTDWSGDRTEHPA